MMKENDKIIQWYHSRFQEFERSLNGEKFEHVHSLRKLAIEHFVDSGFPNNKQEEWRFTNIAPIVKTEFQPIYKQKDYGITQKDIESFTIDNAVRLVFVNGGFSKDLSTEIQINGVLAGGFAELSKQNTDLIKSYICSLIYGNENAFTALNTAFLWDGAFIYIKSKSKLTLPIQLIFITTNVGTVLSSQPRNLVILEKDTKLELIETYIGASKNNYLTNVVTEIFVGENSQVEHNKIQMESVNGYHISNAQIKLNASSKYFSNSITIGGGITRNNLTTILAGKNAESQLNGLSVGASSQLIDDHTAIEHSEPNCSSHELYKFILSDKSKGVFNGKILVKQDAQKTDARQTNRTLLLSDEATINTKPQLEIFADDVKCTHGAAVGQLDEDQIFYLRSRGIGAAEARDILTHAFANEIVNKISNDTLRLQVERIIGEKISNVTIE